MVVQLSQNMDRDCQCLAPHSRKARYAKFFKLAVTGFGYTFVGKGVRTISRKVLEHEAVVYNAVPHLQGFLIPVFLGIVDLDRPIPLPDLVRVAHIMLMSYAGPDFADPRNEPSDIDAEWEMRRTTGELERAGIFNEDVRPANVAWNAEVRRVMHFDFDRVDLSELPPAPKVEEEEEEEEEEEGEGADEHQRHGRTLSKHAKTGSGGAVGVRSPLMSGDGSNIIHGSGINGDIDGLVEKHSEAVVKVED